MLGFVPFLGDREDVCKFSRGLEYTKIIEELKKLVENIGEFRGTGLKNYRRYTIRSTRFGGVELKKGFPNLVYRKFDRGHSSGGCRVERKLVPLVINIRIGNKG